VPAAPAARSAHLLVIPAGHPGGATEVAASGAWREPGPALSRRSRRAVPSLWWRRTRVRAYSRDGEGHAQARALAGCRHRSRGVPARVGAGGVWAVGASVVGARGAAARDARSRRRRLDEDRARARLAHGASGLAPGGSGDTTSAGRETMEPTGAPSPSSSSAGSAPDREPSVTVADGPRGSSCSTASTCCSRFVNSAGSTGIACRRAYVRLARGGLPRQPAGWSAVACAKKRQIASVASGPRGSV
jgi:hypothetical protein